MRVVIDTNQLVAALVRPPELATFIMAWESARFTVLGSSELLEEYDRVLADPDIAILIYPELLRAFSSHLREDIELIEPPEIPRLCRDPDDDKVIAVALYGLADYILTVDKDLLAPEVLDIMTDFGISIASAAEFITVLDHRSN